MPWLSVCVDNEISTAHGRKAQASALHVKVVNNYKANATNTTFSKILFRPMSLRRTDCFVRFARIPAGRGTSNTSARLPHQVSLVHDTLG